MRLLLTTCLAVLLLATPVLGLADNAQPLAGQNGAKLTEAIESAEAGFAKKPIFKGENYDIVLFAFRKGQSLPPHTIALDAFIQVLVGRAIVEIDGNEYEVAAGEMLSLPKNLSHALTAKEDFKMLLVK